MTKIAIIYHSGFGHTAMQAKAVEEGAKSIPGTEVTVMTVDEAKDHLEELHTMDAFIFGSPTYMGSISGSMKNFMETTAKFWFEQKWRNKIAAGFTNSSNPSGDKLNTLVSLAIFAAQHGMIWVSLDLLPGVEEKNRLGGWLGAMGQSSRDPKDALLTENDIATAKYLGAHVATITQQFINGKK